MNWITDRIAIGNFLDAQDPDLLRKEAIGSILGLTDALQGRRPADLGVKQLEVIPVGDALTQSAMQLETAIQVLAELERVDPPVLIHCHAGRSRSVVVVAAHLMRSQGLSVDEALALISSKREIALSPALEHFLRQR